jgi:hypothetical protein
VTVSFAKHYGAAQNDGKKSSEYLSTSDLSDGTYLFKAMKHDASNPGQVVLCDAGAGSIGDIPLGVLYNAPAAGEIAEIAETDNQTWFLLVDSSSTAIAEGDWLKTNASGLGVKTTTSGDWVFARAKRPSSGVNGDKIPVRLVVPHRIR